MLSLNKTDKPIVDLYKNDLIDYKLKKDANPIQTIYYDEKNKSSEVQIIQLEDDYVSFPKIILEKRYAFFISGASGSGKTTTTANLIKIFLKSKPEIFVIYYTGCPIDDPLDNYLKLICNKNLIKITPKIIANDSKVLLSVDELYFRLQQKPNHPRECLIIFDDIESISNKMIRTALLTFQDEILERGRSHAKNYKNINLISIIHSTQNWNSTRKLLKECDYSIFNLRVVNINTIENIIKMFGYSEEVVEYILLMKRKGNTITWFGKNYPFVIFNNNNIILQN